MSERENISFWVLEDTYCFFASNEVERTRLVFFLVSDVAREREDNNISAFLSLINDESLYLSFLYEIDIRQELYLKWTTKNKEIINTSNS